jgi:hypothetical protein
MSRKPTPRRTEMRRRKNRERLRRSLWAARYSPVSVDVPSLTLHYCFLPFPLGSLESAGACVSLRPSCLLDVRIAALRTSAAADLPHARHESHTVKGPLSQCRGT